MTKNKPRRAADVFVNVIRLITVLKCCKHKDPLVVVMLDELEKQVTVLSYDGKSKKKEFTELPSVAEIIGWVIQIAATIISNITISCHNSGNRLNTQDEPGCEYERSAVFNS